MIDLAQLDRQPRGANTKRRTLGFQMRTLNGPSSMDFNNTGVGHDHLHMMTKNLLRTTALAACGYNWQTRATSIAQATPPGKPITFE